MPESYDPWTAVFSPDGRSVVATSVTGAYSWDLADLDADPTLLMPSDDWVTEIAFSPSGDTLAMAGVFPDIDLMDLTRPDKPVSKLRGHDASGVHTLAFSSDGRTLASGGRVDATVRLWDPSSLDA